MEVFERFGAQVERLPDGLILRVHRPLTANAHWTDYASVTTTENFVLCAALAEGVSTLTNAASEPHVQEFCNFMSLLGAKIEGHGTSKLKITGVQDLGGADYTFDCTGNTSVMRQALEASGPLYYSDIMAAIGTKSGMGG